MMKLLYSSSAKIGLSLLLAACLSLLGGCLPDRASDDESSTDEGLPLLEILLLRYDASTGQYVEVTKDTSVNRLVLAETQIGVNNPNYLVVGFNVIGEIPQLAKDEVPPSVKLELNTDLTASAGSDVFIYQGAIFTLDTIEFIPPDPNDPTSTWKEAGCPEFIPLVQNCRLIVINDDDVFEKLAVIKNNRIEHLRYEEFGIRIHSAKGLRIPDEYKEIEHRIYIEDDDPAPTVSISLPNYLQNAIDTTTYEISESQPSIPFEVKLEVGRTEWPLFIDLTLTGTAEKNADYIPLDSFYFNPKDENGNLNTSYVGFIPLSDDVLGEGTEDLIITLNPDDQAEPDYVLSFNNSVTINILDNEGNGAINPTITNDILPNDVQCVDPTVDSTAASFDPNNALVDCASYTAVNWQDGHAAGTKSYNFTVDASGDCVTDNHTSLTWEIKDPPNSALPREYYGYTWYNPFDHSNGGMSGGEGHTTDKCGGIPGSCNTESYVAYVNAIGLCGYTDWRLPTASELYGLVSFNQFVPTNTRLSGDLNNVGNVYWTRTPVAGDPESAWIVNFTTGELSPAVKVNTSSTSVGGAGIILVRSGG